jgi:hypothetical protein
VSHDDAHRYVSLHHTCDHSLPRPQILTMYIVSYEWPCEHNIKRSSFCLIIYLFVLLLINAIPNKLHKLRFGIQIQERTSWKHFCITMQIYCPFMYTFWAKTCVANMAQRRPPKSCMSKIKSLYVTLGVITFMCYYNVYNIMGVIWCRIGNPCDKTCFKLRLFSSCCKRENLLFSTDCMAQNLHICMWCFHNIS